MMCALGFISTRKTMTATHANTGGFITRNNHALLAACILEKWIQTTMQNNKNKLQ